MRPSRAAWGTWRTSRRTVAPMPCATSTSRMPPRSSSITRKRSNFPATARRMAPSRPERRSTSIFGTVKAIPCSARARSSRATASGSVAPVESSRRARRTRSSSPPDVVHESTMATRAGSAPSPTSWSRASTALRCVPESLDDIVTHSTSEPHPSRRRNSP